MMTINDKTDLHHVSFESDSRTSHHQNEKKHTMKKREPVSHIMAKSIISVNTTQSLRDVKKILETENIRHIPVVSGSKLIGIISKTDIAKLSIGAVFGDQGSGEEAILDMLSIEQLMTKHPKSVSSDTLIRDVAEMLVSEEFHSLPVVDDGKIVGIVTSTDIIKYMLEQY
jgi:CBS domain-containing protein